MSALPSRFASVIVCFQPLFRQRTWRHAQALRLGAILAPGIRTVASVLRVWGRARERRFVNYHRVLSRAVWSPRAAARVPLSLLVRPFVPEGPIVLGIDETLERRRGARIAAKGIYYDAVRSSRSHFAQGRFEPQALLCTDLSLVPMQIVTHFVRGWQREVTFEESRRHLAMETQRQWSEQAIARTTPALLALFSIVTVWANRLVHHQHLPLRQSAWYRKAHPIFRDALAPVRRYLWRAENLSSSRRQPHSIKIPRGIFRRLQEAACYAA